MSRSQKKN